MKRKAAHYHRFDKTSSSGGGGGGGGGDNCLTAANFDGSWAIDASNLSLGNFGLMLWIRLRDEGDRASNGWKNSIFAADTWHIGFQDNKLRIFNQEGQGDVFISNTTFNFGEWYFVGLVYEGGELEFFIGNAGSDPDNPVATTLEERSESGVDLGSYSNAKTIGKYGGNNLIADIDEFAFFWDTPAGLMTYIKAQYHGKYDLEADVAVSDMSILYTFDEEDGFTDGGNLINTAPEASSTPTLSIDGSIKISSVGAPPYCGDSSGGGGGGGGGGDTGECCNAMVFNGSTEHLDPNSEIDLGEVGALQGSFRFKRSSNKQKDTLFAGSNWRLHRKSDGKLALTYAGNELLVTPDQIPQNIIKWITLNWDNDTIKLFDNTTELVSYAYTPGSGGDCKSLILTGNDLIELPAQLALGGTFTIAFWAEFEGNSYPFFDILFSNSDASMQLVQQSNNLLFIYNSEEVWSYVYHPGPGVPTHYALRLHDNRFDLFINGYPSFTYVVIGCRALIAKPNTYIKIDSTVPPGNENYASFTTYLKLDNVSGIKPLFSNDANNTTPLEIYVEDANVKVKLDGSIVATSSTSLLADTWYHIGVTINTGGDTIIYIDATADDTQTTPSITDPFIGANQLLRASTIEAEDCHLFYPRIYGTELTQANISTDKDGKPITQSGLNFQFGLNFSDNAEGAYELSYEGGIAATVSIVTDYGAQGANITSLGPSLWCLNPANDSGQIFDSATVKYFAADPIFNDIGFNGKMDSIEIWTSYRSDSEILAGFSSPPVGDETGLSHFYPIKSSDSGLSEIEDLVNAAGNAAFKLIDTDGTLITNTVELASGLGCNEEETLPENFSLTLKHIGHDGAADNHFEGDADEIRVWDESRDGNLDIWQEISSPQSESNLKAYYSFEDQDSGDGTVQDKSSNNNDSQIGTGSLTITEGFTCENDCEDGGGSGGGGGGTGCKILHFTKTDGWDHETREESQQLFNWIAQELNATVVHDNDGSNFDSLANLKTFGLIVFSNVTGNPLSANQRANAQSYFEDGGGYLGIHAASDCYRHSSANGGGNGKGVWDYYAENLTGYTVQQNPNHTDVKQGTMDKVGTHPTTESAPNPWQKQEEWYYYLNGYINTSDFTPVLTVRETGDNAEDVERTIAHYSERSDGGRSFYTALGHAESYYTGDDNFRKHIKDATQWVCEGGGGDDGGGGGGGTLVTVGGVLRRWHWVDLRIEGDDTSENSGTNPYADYKLDVIFTHTDTNRSISVPGHYAADYNAANTSATSGKYWRCYFRPPYTGGWSYEVVFRKGVNIAASLSNSSGSPMAANGVTGSFNVQETNKGGKDFRKHGRKIIEPGKNFHRFEGSGLYSLRHHVGSPENFLAYYEFDGTYDEGGGLEKPGLTDGLHQYADHASDWESGDPTWGSNKGKAIIGVINYLSELNVNGIYTIMHTSDGGDGRDVWPWTGPSTHDRYDVSKLDQWEIVMRHASTKGVEFHLFFHEVENQSAITSSINNEEKIYIREMISRFGHLGINWNLGEECSLSTSAKNQRFEYFRDIDPYKAPLAFHTQVYSDHNQPYSDHWGNTDMDCLSIQEHINNIDDVVLEARSQSIQNDNYLAIYFDEQTTPVAPNGGNPFEMRLSWLKCVTHGGAGGSLWYGYQGTHGDVQTDEFNTTASLLAVIGGIRAFFEGNIPFYRMSNANELVNNGNYCLALPGTQWVVYGNPNQAKIDLTGETGTYPVQFLDPSEPYFLQEGSVTSVEAGSADISLGTPPNNQGGKDWIIIIGDTITPEENGINGTGGGGGSGGGGNCAADYKEANGLVTIEAESLDYSSVNWGLDTEHSGYTGNGYLKYDGSDHFDSPGNEVITIQVELTSAGTKRFQLRQIITEGTDISEHNDCFVKIEGVDEYYASNGSNIYYAKGDPRHPSGPFPNGSGGNGYFKLYFNPVAAIGENLRDFIWRTQTSDEQIDHWIYIDVNSPRVITIKIAGRSQGYGFDRITIWDISQTDESTATNINNGETICEGDGGGSGGGDGTGGGGSGGGGGAAGSRYVVHIDIPGLRGDIVQTLISNGQANGIFKAANEGAWTENARIDADITYLLGGAISQITGRPVLGSHGHGYLFENYQNGTSVSSESIYNVLDSLGFNSSLYAVNLNTKNLIDASYPNINVSHFGATDSLAINQFLNDMPNNLFRYSFIQLFDLVTDGRNAGWNNNPSSSYAQSVIAASNLIQQVIDLIQINSELKDKTYLIITSSHGGEAFDYTNPADLNTYRVPFIVWGGGVANDDLYNLNIGKRANPGTQTLPFDEDDSTQPIYHADAANLALSILCSEQIIPQSVINNDMELSVGLSCGGSGGGSGGGGGGSTAQQGFFQLHGTNFVTDAIKKGAYDSNDSSKNYLFEQPGRFYAHAQDFSKSGVTNQIFTDPMLGFNGEYSMKPYFKQLRDGGMRRFIICLKNNPEFAQGLYGYAGPSAQGGSTTVVDSYELHAKYILLWVRFVASLPEDERPQEIWVQYGNEFEEWWKGSNRQYTYNASDGSANYSYQIEAGNWQPEEYAAFFIKCWEMCSAEANAAGIRLMPPGHVAWDRDHFNRMVEYCVLHNNGEAPYHDICIHYYRNVKHYVTNSYRDGVDWTLAKGARPEAHSVNFNGQNVNMPSMRAEMQEMVDYIRDTPNRISGAGESWKTIGIHWTEHGYDINTGSPHEAYTPGVSGQEAQGRFIARSYLMQAAVEGNDGCWQYFMKHGHSDGENDGNVFQSSGLFNDVTPYAPMISWYYHKQVRELLGNMFCTNWDESNTHVFRFDGDGKTIFAVWKGDSNNNSTQSNVTIDTGGSGTAIIHSHQSTSNSMATDTVTIINGTVTIQTVTEKPVYIEVSNANALTANQVGGIIVDELVIP